MNERFKGPFVVGRYGDTIFRHNDGSMIIQGADEDGDASPVLSVLMTVRPKRGEAWKTSDALQEAFAAHVARVLTENPFAG